MIIDTIIIVNVKYIAIQLVCVLWMIVMIKDVNKSKLKNLILMNLKWIREPLWHSGFERQKGPGFSTNSPQNF